MKLIARMGGAKVETSFLTSIADESFTLVDLQPIDFARMAELVET